MNIINALPISSRMYDETLRIAVGLRLGTPICSPHSCRHCNVLVNPLGRHGLSCRWSEGRHPRHSVLNDIVCRALSSAHVPALLEPTGLSRSDGKRPDGVTIAPWSSGKPLVWDATCPDTFAQSHRRLAVHSAGGIAAKAEDLKRVKCADLFSSHIFVPIAIETSGVFGSKTLSFVKSLGKRLYRHSGDPKSTSYLIQRLSIAIQRGNAISIRGTFVSPILS